MTRSPHTIDPNISSIIPEVFGGILKAENWKKGGLKGRYENTFHFLKVF
ncbi:hypothetical protein AB3N59_14630 [Leptospira sp. WS92.C1]